MTDNDYAALYNGYDEYDHKAIDAALEDEIAALKARKPSVVLPEWLKSSETLGERMKEAGWRDLADAQWDGVTVMVDEYNKLRDELEETLGDWGTVRLELAAAKAELDQIKSGWLRAVDDSMASSHIGVANSSDTYLEARKKLFNLIEWHVQVANDPCVNGGFVLVKVPAPDIDITSDSLCDMIEGSPPASENEALQALLSRKSGFTTSPVEQKK